MKRLKKPSIMLLLVFALLTLLPLLAFLQYHWLGAVSLGEQERMKSNLKASVTHFVRDFDREIKNIYVNFQSGLIRSPDESEVDLVRRYRQWVSSASHPGLISEIYQTSEAESREISLRRMNFTEGRMENVKWPGKLIRLRDDFSMSSQAGRSAEQLINDIFKQKGPRPVGIDQQGTIIQVSTGPIDSQLPAIILHIVSTQRYSGSGAILPGTPLYRIILLDLDYIRDAFLPELGQRYFSTAGNNDYNFYITDKNDSTKVIYRSSSGDGPISVPKGDVESDLFSINLSEPDKLLIAGIDGRQALEHGKKIQQSNRRIAVSVIQSDVRGATGKEHPLPGYVARSLINSVSEGQWRMIVNHRAGSLEAAVANVRRRNLGISFGILILLGMSVGLIVMSSRRAQRLATQQMEFVAGVSHELRTPLAVICSAAENLADGVVDNPNQIMKYGGLIRDEGRRLSGMVEQVLEFAGAQSGRRTYQLKPVSINDVVEDAFSACEASLIEGGFLVDKNIEPGLPVVMADLPALSRAIQNLINNSIKYSGDSRWISIKTTGTGRPNAKEVQIAVSDHGIGIPPADLSRVFEPFYRGKDVAAAQIHGNGLGLSLVRHIIESHGGRVSVSSTPGEGTAITLHLPGAASGQPDEEIENIDEIKQGYEHTNFAR